MTEEKQEQEEQEELKPIKLANLNEQNVTGGLLLQHGFGGFRDESDVNIAKTHTYTTIQFAYELANAEDATLESIKEFLQKCQQEIPKFGAKPPEDKPEEKTEDKPEE